MIQDIEQNLKELGNTLRCISDELYTRKSQYLFGSSMGQHVRHILEMYEVVLKGYSLDQFSYDRRERNTILEESVEEMYFVISRISSEIKKKDKGLICTIYNNKGNKKELKTTYFRELLYCFEHGIHHQALIKVALKEFEWENIPENFGVAPSTIKFRLACVQ